MTEDNRDNLALSISSAPADDSQTLPKARIDVEWTEQVYYGKPCYVLKDPTTLRYYRLRPPEYTIYKMLDGQTGMEDILKTLGDRFPKEQFDAQAVMSFVIMLRGANLLHVPGQTDTEYLLKRKEMLTRGIFKRLRQEFLFFKIPFFDPDKLLNAMHNRLSGLIFRRFTGILVWLMLAGAMALLFSNIDDLGKRQPLLSWINLLYLVPSLYVIKVFHEFGHGLTAKHFGVEVHEMGILFLVFTPCPYCDVSDAWMVAEKAKRMWITAAGIVVEIVLAGLATYIWAVTVPGSIINQFALNVMVVASVSTILFNGNPLLRYDGYYFLMDLMEIPNLKQKSTGYLWYLMQRFVFGMEKAVVPIDTEGRKPALLGYAVSSTIYRWFIMIVIVTMVWKFLDPYGLGAIGGVLALGCIYNSLAMPIIRLIKFLTTQWHQLHIHFASAIILIAIFCSAVYFLLLLPVEQTRETQCVLRPVDMQLLYVTQPGVIDSDLNAEFITDGQAVKAGDVLLVLSDPELGFEVTDLQLQIEQLGIKKREARRQHFDDLAAQIDDEIQRLGEQLKRAERDFNKLTIRSPIDGVVQLRTDQPLKNLIGSYQPLQKDLFAIYQPGKFEAVAAVHSLDHGLVKLGQKVQIKLWAMDDEVIDSEVTNPPPGRATTLSSAAFSTVFGGEVPTMPSADPKDAVTPAENTFEWVLPLEKDMRLRDGMGGRAKFIIEKKTLGAVFYRWLIRALKQDIRL